MQDNLDLLECVYQYSRNLKRNFKDAGHFQMIHNAAGTQNGSKCLKFLLEKGESANLVCNDQDRATPLHFAVISMNAENVKLLLKANANPNAKDSMGNTPMHMAVTVNNLALVKLLDDFGGDATIANME